MAPETAAAAESGHVERLRVALIGHVGNSVLVRGGLEVYLDAFGQALERKGVSAYRRMDEARQAPHVVQFLGSFYGLEGAWIAARDLPRALMPVMLHSDASPPRWRSRFDLLRAHSPSSLISARRRMLSEADLVAPSSIAEADEAHYLGARRVVVVKGGLDTARFSPRAPRLSRLPSAWQGPARRWQEKRGKCLCVARFERRKNQVKVARACQSLGLSALFIGRRSPVEPTYLDELRANWGHQFDFWHDPPTEVVQWAMASSDVHVLASRHETIGLVSLEAAACGCRPVAIDQPTAREYLTPFGVLAKSTDVEDLVEALRLACEKGLIGESERHLLDDLSWDAVAEQMKSLYLEMAYADS